MELPEKTKNNEEATSFPLVDKNRREEIADNNKKRQVIINEYFKNSAKEISKQPEKKKNKKKKQHKSHKVLWTIFLVLLLLSCGFTALVYYVNYYATVPENIENSITKKAAFDYTEPSYITPGYELSYLSDASTTEIKYIYTHFEKTQNKITIDITLANAENSDIYETYIAGSGDNYFSGLVGGQNVWVVEQETVYFSKDGAVYVISSKFISTEELLKIAEGIITG